MRFNKNIILLIILFICIQIYPLASQSMFEGDYVLVQYVAENYGFRSTMHYLTSIAGDSTGTYFELFKEEGEPDSGGFSYDLHEYRTFTIDDSIGLLQGNIDDQGDVFSLVGPEDEGGYFGIGIRKSTGSYQVEWDATGFASGVYFYRLTTSENIAITKKMMLVC